MTLADILASLSIPTKQISAELLSSVILNVDTNSHNITNNSIFVARKGYINNGHKFINQALQNGAIAAIAEIGEEILLEPSLAHKIIRVQDSKQIINSLCSLVYKNIPSNIVMVTGTNGKTSVCTYYSQILQKLGTKVASIGTVGVFFNNQKYLTTSLTTPEITELYKILTACKLEGIEHVILEASSEGLAEGRLNGLPVVAAGFTNLTQDHLNYHKSMANYYQAKSQLFLSMLPKHKVAVINLDDEYGVKLQTECKNKSIAVASYGKNATSLITTSNSANNSNSHNITNIQLISITNNTTGYYCKIKYNQQEYGFQLNILGEFQVYNVLCSIMLVMHSSTVTLVEVLSVIAQLEAANGRLQLVASYKAAKIFVDYAHTQSAILGVLTSLRKITTGKLIIVFGAGGNRDVSKRELMGSVAATYADVVYITDDNPRNEEPNSIRAAIEEGFIKANTSSIYYNIAGRSEAIKLAIESLASGDTLLIAGKGHEEYQIINNQTIHFSDSEAVTNVINNQNSANN